MYRNKENVITMKVQALFSVIIIACIGFTINAAQIISPVVQQGGEVYDFFHVFTSPEELTFSLSDKSIAGEWSICMRTSNNGYEEVDAKVESGDCVFNPRNVKWVDAHREYDPESHRSLYEIRVSFKTDGDMEDVHTVKFGLLPKHPEISNISFTYVYNWDIDAIYPNGTFSFRVDAEGATSFRIHLTDWFLFSSENCFFSTGMSYPQCHDNIEVVYDAEWGEYLKVDAWNEFGHVISDIICTTDYITDIDILNRIEELKRLAGTEDHFVDAQNSLEILENSIRAAANISCLAIYNMQGQIILEQTGGDTMDISNIPKGMYIIAYTDKTGHTNSLKYLRK